MASSEDVGAAFNAVDALLVAARETAPAMALLMDRAAANGISKEKLASNLRTNTTVMRWILQAKPPAIRDGITDAVEEEEAGAVILKWARS